MIRVHQAMQGLPTWSGLGSSAYLLPNIARKIWEYTVARSPTIRINREVLELIWCDYRSHWREALDLTGHTALEQISTHVWRLPMWSCLLGKAFAGQKHATIRAWLFGPNCTGSLMEAMTAMSSSRIVDCARWCLARVAQTEEVIDLTHSDS